MSDAFAKLMGYPELSDTERAQLFDRAAKEDPRRVFRALILLPVFFVATFLLVVFSPLDIYYFIPAPSADAEVSFLVFYLGVALALILRVAVCVLPFLLTFVLWSCFVRWSGILSDSAVQAILRGARIRTNGEWVIEQASLTTQSTTDRKGSAF